MYLAWQNLLKDKTRFALSVGGIALAIMLILILNGFLTGMYKQFSTYLDHTPGSIVVAQADVVNLLGATSLLPFDADKRVETIEGVSQVIPILSQFVILDLHAKKQPAYMIGFEFVRGGGPWELFEGRQPLSKREIVFDRVLAERHGLGIGDMVDVLGKSFTIVGLSNDTTSWMTSFFFISKQDAEDILLAPGAISFLLVSPMDSVDFLNVLQNINALPGVNALTKAEMSENDIKLFSKVFSAPLKLMVSIAFLVGTMIVGLVIYTITVERQREYGALKAIGAPNHVLYQVVLAQALAAALAGSLTGVFLAYGLGQMIMAARPQFYIVFDPMDVGWALLAGLGMALASAFFPAQVVAKLAPAEVFR